MKKKGFMRVVLALLMSMLLIVSTGCGKSGNGGSSSGKKSGKTATLADMNEIPEDGIITKEQFKTVAGENKKVQFKGTTDNGITYIWTYDCSKIQNPADQMPLSSGTYTRPSVPVVTVSTRPPSLTRRISKVVLGIRWVLSAAFTFTSSSPPMGAL